MTSRSSEYSESYLRFRRLLVGGSLTVLLIATVLVAQKIQLLQHAREEAMRAEANAMAHAAKTHALRSIRTADLALFGLANAIKTLPAENGYSVDPIRQLLSNYGFGFSDDFRLLFIDARGVGQASSDDQPVQHVSYADRDYFRAHTSGNGNNNLYVGSPALGRVSGTPLFFLSRRVETANGRFLGVIAAPMNARRLADILESARNIANASIILSDQHNRVIARTPGFDESFGGSLRDGTLAVGLQAEKPAGSSASGTSRLHAYQALDPLPLAVTVEMPVKKWSDELKSDLFVGGSGILLMATVLFLGCDLVLTSHASLDRSEARYRQLYTSIRDGVVLVSEHDRIEDCNQAFLDLIGCSREEIVHSDFRRWAPAVWCEADGRAMHERLLRYSDRNGFDLDYRHANGSLLHVNMKLWRLPKRSGRPAMICALVRDISDRKRAQDALRMAHDDLDRKVFRSTVELTNAVAMLKSEIDERKQVEDALRRSQQQLRRLGAHREEVREEERKRIAREIHDELGGLLTGIKANVSVALDRTRLTVESRKQLLSDTVGLADAAIVAVRRVISDLRPSVLDQIGIWEALKWYAAQIEQRTGLSCRCVIDENVTRYCFDAEHTTMLFRITQEALTNVVRHAHALHATIRVMQLTGTLILEVEDDGKGIDEDRLLAEDAWGILGMHERARHFGCELRISGAPGQGTVVVLRIPLEGLNAVQEDQAIAG